LIAAVALGFALLLLRGPWRIISGATEASDVQSLYSGSHLLATGENPYDPDTLVSTARKAGYQLHGRLIYSVYPPPSILLMSVLTWLPWPAFVAAAAVLSMMLVILCGWMLGRAAKLSSQGQLVLLALAMAFGPFHSAISVGNPGSLAVPLAGIGAALWVRERDTAAGILLGIACVLKPQVALILLLAMLLSRSWRAVVAAGLVGALISAVSVGWLLAEGTAWWQDYLNAIRFWQLQGHFGAGSFEERFGVVSLDILAAEWVPVQWVRPLSISVSILVAGWMGRAIRNGMRMRSAQLGSDSLPDRLAILSLAALFTLLPVYHRYGDAGLLLIPITWCLQEWGNPRARWALLLMAPFWLPLPAILRTLGDRIPETLREAWFWNRIVMPHQIWLLLVLCVMLTGTLASAPRKTTNS
jgi:hypothetical protein